MAVRQYVGARYVPKFYEFNNGVWQSNSEYEPLTIVQYNGNSYTSKKAVPSTIGDPSANPAYWVATGNYNAQVELYRQEVENYKEQCDDYGEKSLNAYKSTNKNVLLFSDSYGMADGQGGWCSKAANLLTGIGGSCNYLAKSGYGFVGNEGTFLSEITDYANNMTTPQKEAITDVVIGGGWNDSGKTQSDIITAMNTCLSYCKTTFPNARIWVAFMAFDTQYSILNDLMISVEPTYRAGALKNGCFYMTNLPYITHNTNNMTDTRHPNDNGYSLIAKMVVEYLINGESNADLIRVPMNIDLIEGIDNSDISNAYQHAHNGIVETFMDSSSFSIQPGVLNLQFDSGHPVKIQLDWMDNRFTAGNL